MGNEDQDTAALLEKCADVDKRRVRLPEAKGFVESTVVTKWQRYIDEVKKWEDSRLPLVGGCIMRGRNRVTRSSVRGTTRPGLSCAKGGTR